MKIVGIFGYPGSGKTEVCNYLVSKHNNIVYVNVDNIISENEKINRLRKYLIFSFYNGFLSKKNIKIMSKKLNNEISNEIIKKIDSLRKENIDLILIEYARMNVMKNVLNVVDYTIFIKRPSKKRYQGIINRGGESGGKIVAKMLDIYVKKIVIDDVVKPNYIIYNNSTLENLYTKTDKIISSIINM